jgi:hypothetical protein
MLCDAVQASVCFENWRRLLGEGALQSVGGAADRKLAEESAGPEREIWEKLRKREERVGVEQRREKLGKAAEEAHRALASVLLVDGGWMSGEDDELRRRTVPVAVFKAIAVCCGQGEWELAVGNNEGARAWLERGMELASHVAHAQNNIMECMEGEEKKRLLQRFAEVAVLLLQC